MKRWVVVLTEHETNLTSLRIGYGGETAREAINGAVRIDDRLRATSSGRAWAFELVEGEAVPFSIEARLR